MPRHQGCVLDLEGLVVGHEGRALLPPLSAHVDRGQLWAIIGPNGCGKTTTLRTILALQAPVHGQVRWEPGVKIGYVPQRASLNSELPLRVLDMVAGGVDTHLTFLRPLWRRQRRQAIEQALRDTRTWELRLEPFARLSEGQKQRVLMARALAMEPQVLLLDEPTSAMDVFAEGEVFGLLDELRRSRQIAVMLVSHHLSVVTRHASHALFLDREQRCVVAGSLSHVLAHERWIARYGDGYACACEPTQPAQAKAAGSGPSDEDEAHHSPHSHQAHPADLASGGAA